MTYPTPEDWPSDERMNNIGPNGNDGDHYDLNSYLSEKDELKSLKKEVVELRENNRKLKLNVIQWKSKYKKIHFQFKGTTGVLTRGEKAKLMIKETIKNGFNGFSVTHIKRIAKLNNLSVDHTKDIWYFVLNDYKKSER
jgi:hypothetical protein